MRSTPPTSARRPAGCTPPCWLLGELQAKERQGNVVGRKPTRKQTQRAASLFHFTQDVFFSLIKNIFIFFCRVKNLGCSRCGWIKPVISGGLLFNQAATSCQFFLFFPSSFPLPLVAELLVIPHQTLFVICKKKKKRNGHGKREGRMNEGQWKSGRKKSATVKFETRRRDVLMHISGAGSSEPPLVLCQSVISTVLASFPSLAPLANFLHAAGC